MATFVAEWLEPEAMVRASRLAIGLSCVMLLLGCLCLGQCSVCSSPSGDAERLNSRQEAPGLERELERANQLAASRSELQIEGYIRRHGLPDMQRNGQGMSYKVWGTPIGQPAKNGVQVAVAYQLELLDGTTCGQADTLAPLEFTLGRRDQPAGLEELIQHMAPGQQGLAIVPPHLGYGLVGDKEAGVPPHACLVYRVYWLRYPKQ